MLGTSCCPSSTTIASAPLILTLSLQFNRAMEGFDPRILEELTGGAPVDWSNPQSLFDNINPNLPKPAGFPSPEQVRKERQDHANQIFEDWGLLNQLIQRYEPTIQKRWLGKTRPQRKKILLSAWPQMAEQHRPDLEAFLRESTPGPTRFEEHYEWPHVNQEDLLKPKLLPILINARARHPPSVFAMADRDSVSFAFTAGKMAPAFLNGYTMMFTGRDTPAKYGELLSWDDHEDAFDWMFTQRGVHPGEGLQVLEIQERLYGFLLACCRDILHDASDEDLVSAPVQPEPPRLSTAEPGIDSLAAVTTEAPYRVPAHLDLRRLQGLVTARRSAAEDHIWSLREDPGYFADVVLDMKEHRQEILPDIIGQKHPLMRPSPSSRFWERVLGNLITDAYFPLVIWDDLHSQITHLQALMEKHAGQIKPENELPPELLNSYLQLWTSLNGYIEGPIGNLKVDAPPSPPLRQYFVRGPDMGNPNRIIVESRQSGYQDGNVARLMWALRTLWDQQQLHLAGLDTIMYELERLMQDKPQTRPLLSSRVAGMISELAILSECRRQITLYQPWAASFENHAASSERDSELKADYSRRTKALQELMSGLNTAPLVNAGEVSDGRFRYPVDKRKTRENTEVMQAAERNLDLFWTKVDGQFLHKTSLFKHPALRNLLSDERILHRTPDWEESDSARPANQRVDSIEELCRPLSQIYFELEHRTQSTLAPEKTPVGKKTKVKTRGAPQPAEQPADETAQQVNMGPDPDIQPTFTVDKRAYKVFSTLFYRPSRTAQPGEIPWNDFLHAMGMTGFAIEKLYGSVWQFTPSRLDVERTIQFHEPHPVVKIPFRTVRRFGRRLARAYGWHGDMFKLDE